MLGVAKGFLRGLRYLASKRRFVETLRRRGFRELVERSLAVSKLVGVRLYLSRLYRAMLGLGSRGLDA